MRGRQQQLEKIWLIFPDSAIFSMLRTMSFFFFEGQLIAFFISLSSLQCLILWYIKSGGKDAQSVGLLFLGPVFFFFSLWGLNLFFSTKVHCVPGGALDLNSLALTTY